MGLIRDGLIGCRSCADGVWITTDSMMLVRSCRDCLLLEKTMLRCLLITLAGFDL